MLQISKDPCTLALDQRHVLLDGNLKLIQALIDEYVVNKLKETRVFTWFLLSFPP